MTRRRFLIFSISFCGLMIAAILLPLELMRNVFPPADRLASGPLYGGVLVIGPPLLMMVVYFIGPLKRVLPAVRAAGYSQAARNAALSQLTFKPDLVTVAPAICFMFVYVYGLSAYWYATREGVFEQANIFARPTVYLWKDAVQRHLSCYRTKRGSNAKFVLTFNDGSTLDIADTQQQMFVENFWTLMRLTAAATLTTDVIDPSICPGPASLFLSDRKRPEGT